MQKTVGCVAAVLAIVLSAAFVQAADIAGLEKGSPELSSAGPLAFGPEGVLLIGDPKAAAIVAVATGDTKGNPDKVKLEINNLDVKVAKALGAKTATINDLAVNPMSGNVYLSLTADNEPAIARINGDGSIERVSLKDVPSSRATLPDAPPDKAVGSRGRNYRLMSITDLTFMDGQILVSGMGGQTPASTVRMLAFPPTKADSGTNLEIYHAAHGRSETNARLTTFVPFMIGDEPHLLGAYVCTPLVKFPVKSLVSGSKTTGTTVAELGNRNQPLDMVSYTKDGKTFLLLSNSARGVMKISTDNLDRKEGLTEPVRGGGKAGQSYETIKQLEGCVQMDKLNDTHAIVVLKTDDGLNLQTVALP